MKTSTRLVLALAAACFGFLRVAPAQVLTNTDTYDGYASSAITFASFSNSLYQTFGNVSAIHSMTFNFFSNGGDSAASKFTATIGEWNGASFVAGTSVVIEQDFDVPASAGWDTQTIGNFTGRTYEKLLDLTALSDPLVHPQYGYLTDSSKTYAIVITQTAGPNTLALGANFTDPLSEIKVGFNGGTNLGTTDWVFSQMSVYAGDQILVPVPESSTVAAIAGAVLVAGLVVVRTRQRRQLAVEPPATTV